MTEGFPYRLPIFYECFIGFGKGLRGRSVWAFRV